MYETESFHWRTSISYKSKDEIIVRGYDLNELTGNIDFASMAYLTICGDLPNDQYRLMLNAILVSMAEHAFSPSSASCRFVRSGGVPLNTAVAGGVLTMGERHASADIPAKMFQDIINDIKNNNISIEDAARNIVSSYRKEGKILNGYHHPQHIIDPRVERLKILAHEFGLIDEHYKLALAIQECTVNFYKNKLYLNAPGIIAAITSDMGLSPEQIKGFMILSRTVSLVAHSIEEKEREKAWRASKGSEIMQPLDLSLQLPEYYDGPSKRTIINKK